MLATVNPNTHCPHVGPSGGKKCVDHSIDEALYTDDYLSCKHP